MVATSEEPTTEQEAEPEAPEPAGQPVVYVAAIVALLAAAAWQFYGLLFPQTAQPAARPSASPTGLARPSETTFVPFDIVLPSLVEMHKQPATAFSVDQLRRIKEILARVDARQRELQSLRFGHTLVTVLDPAQRSYIVKSQRRQPPAPPQWDPLLELLLRRARQGSSPGKAPKSPGPSAPSEQSPLAEEAQLGAITVPDVFRLMLEMDAQEGLSIRPEQATALHPVMLRLRDAEEGVSRGLLDIVQLLNEKQSEFLKTFEAQARSGQRRVLNAGAVARDLGD